MTMQKADATFSCNPATVTNASRELVAADLYRRYLLIQNNDATGDIYIQFGASQASTVGCLKIPAGGGTYEMNTAQSSQPVQAIGSIASNSNIVVVRG